MKSNDLMTLNKRIVLNALVTTQIEELMKEQGHEFMWNERLGYICTCPSNLGTVLRCSVHMQLKLLSKVSSPSIIDVICSAKFSCFSSCIVFSKLI